MVSQVRPGPLDGRAAQESRRPTEYRRAAGIIMLTIPPSERTTHHMKNGAYSSSLADVLGTFTLIEASPSPLRLLSVVYSCCGFGGRPNGDEILLES